MGVEELIRTFSRSSPSGIISLSGNGIEPSRTRTHVKKPYAVPTCIFVPFVVDDFPQLFDQSGVAPL